MMRGTSKVPPEIWSRARTAKMLNRSMGTTAFHIWNIDEVPDVDLRCLMIAVDMINSFPN